jgi:molecular chaperone GrpE
MSASHVRHHHKHEEDPAAGHGAEAPGRERGAHDADEAGATASPRHDEPQAVDELRAELDTERKRADENWDKYLRAVADLDNLRKRNVRLREEALERQRREVLGRFLEVADNLERALSHGGADPEALLAGVETTYRDLARILAQEGVQSMEALEQPFDPELHEAVGVVPLLGEGPERVVVVERNGYTVNGELLRAARVIVGRPSGAGRDGQQPESGQGGAGPAAGPSDQRPADDRRRGEVP